jgi:23S rRNA pseudouridine2605 synthase
MSAERKVGLARALSKLGYCSRSQAVDLIRAGRASLNGRKRLDPETPVQMVCDRICVDDRPITKLAMTYLMLNKPRGIVTTASDEKGRKTVYGLLPAGLPWIAPVGRLDKASEGLLLFTNDSEWAALITDPAVHLDKTYHVQISSLADDELIAKLEQGIRSEGETLRLKSATVLRHGTRNSWLELVLQEGRNRHIRRMLEAVDIEVLRLIRISIGPLQLGNLQKGKFRDLNQREILDLASNLPSLRTRPRTGSSGRPGSC